jgi:1-aminocyclopropane-1-carboxylate deaminase/D-cysteine desulfhydrase-like pyridoxal-dependent ACC family enzyme
LPCAGIADLPTPLESLDALARRLGVGRSLVKRDDLTASAYGGNKVRKLDHLLGQALAEKRTSVITYGAYGSNHALATAVYARALGLEPHVVLSPQAPGPFAAATLRAHADLGTVVHPVEGWDGTPEGARVSAELFERDRIEPFDIPMGGTNALGALGYVNAAIELVDQVRELDAAVDLAARPDSLRDDVIYVAAGTLGTAIGLAIGLAAVGSHTRVVAVRVTPAEVAFEQVAVELAGTTIALLRSLDDSFPDLAYDDLAFDLREDWFEPGYGVVTPETLEAVALAAEDGIKLETTYAGKAFAAMVADARAGALEGRRVIFWDTYNSAPMPLPGDVCTLPRVLREYVAECDRVFPPA